MFLRLPLEIMIIAHLANSDFAFGGRYTTIHESLVKNIKLLLISSVANHLF
jgi:hypothetical protein